MVFNATFNDISVISWPSVLLVEEAAVPGEKHYFVLIFPPLFTYLSLLPPSLPNSLYSILNIYTEKELIHIDMVDLT